MATLTRGNIIVEEIKVGDTHFEYEMGIGVQSTVLTKPERSDDGYWTWKAKSITGKEIKYGVREGMSHYAPNLYDYRAYNVKCYI